MDLSIEERTLETAFRLEPILDLSDKNFLIKGRYRVLKLIFESSNTNIFMGADLKSRKKVYVHVVKNQFFQKGKILKAWIQSIKQMKAMSGHPGAFQVHDMDLWKRKFFVVTDHFEGIPIFNLLITKKELPIWYTLKIVMNLAYLLRESYKKPFESRLISKEDLFVARDGSVHLLRFRQRRMGMSNSKPDEIQDVYSLAVILYELLTHEVPFSEKRKTIELEHAHFLASLKVRVNQDQADIFPAICDLFVRCTSPKADKVVEGIDDFIAQVNRLYRESIRIQEEMDDRIEREELNSAFDVVFALKGDAASTPDEPRQYSRVWSELEVESKGQWDTEVVFRWVAVTIIILTFLYKLYG